MDLSALILFTELLILSEAVAAIAGFITWQKWKHSYLKWFPVYLGFITVLESMNRLLANDATAAMSGWVRNIAAIIEMLFISAFFYRLLPKQHKKIPAAGIILFLISWVLEKTVMSSNDYFFQSLSYTTGNLFILIYLVVFFRELARSEDILQFKKLTVFWVSLGLLIFYLGTFPFYGLYNELAKDMHVFVPVAWIATILNHIMYLLFTIGFIWGKAG